MDVETLYVNHYKPLLRFVASRIGNHDDAEDIVSQVFEQATRQVFDDKTPHAWLYAVARSRIIDRHRKITRHREDAFDTWDAAHNGGIDTLIERASTPHMRAALATLTADQRQVIELRFLQDYDLPTTAERLSISVGQVKALQHRAMTALQRQLGAGATQQKIVPHGQKHSRAWSDVEMEQLRLGVARGLPYTEIARQLKRTETAIRVRVKRYGCAPSQIGSTGTAREVAALLGLGCAKTVTRWIDMGWLPARLSADGGVWRILWADLWAFLEKPEHWMAWHPERITDPARRTWAIAMRSNQPRWLTPGEVAKRYHISRNVVHTWVERFGLPATRYGNYWINERELVGWVAPSERPRRPRWKTPTNEPVWLSTADLAKRFNVARTTPSRWIAKGFLPGTRKGRCWFVHERDLLGWQPPRA